MHTTTVRSAQLLGILSDTMPWLSRIRSILRSRWHRKSGDSKCDSLYRLEDQLLADAGLYRDHRIHNSNNRPDQQQESPIPAALLAMWMTRI